VTVTPGSEPTSTPDNSPDVVDGADAVADLDALVGDWLTLPDVAELLGIPVTAVRRLLDEGELLAVRRGERSVLSVPAKFVTPEGPLTHLRGTLTVLKDGRLGDVEAMTWLFTPDPTLRGGGSPIDALVAGQKTEIRRRAAELAL
jgi:excisionase family DNA binding protein